MLDHSFGSEMLPFQILFLPFQIVQVLGMLNPDYCVLQRNLGYRLLPIQSTLLQSQFDLFLEK